MDEWHHVCVVKAGGVAKVYVDGVLGASGSVGASASYTGSLNVGRKADAADGDWGGSLDDLAVYSRALSEAEVLALRDVGAFATVESAVAATSPKGSVLLEEKDNSLPVIAKQPVAVVVDYGKEAVLSVGQEGKRR